VPDASPTARLQADLEATLDAAERDLHSRFGWAGSEVSVRTDRNAVRIDGWVVTERRLRALLDQVRAVVPAEQRITHDRLTVLRTHRWRAPRERASLLYRRMPGHERDTEVTSELVSSDGPVEVLVDTEHASLVRTVAGVVGWMPGEVDDAEVAPPPMRRPHRRADLSDTVARYLGTTYRLGGTTRRGMDCSGFVWRVYRRAFDKVIPRHSHDQLLGDERAVRHIGDLVGTESGSTCHVGLFVGHDGRGAPLIAHASTSRRRVVVDPLDAFAAGATTVRVVSRDDLLAW
jgi:cell wall-associated NlpC family hydrolase